MPIKVYELAKEMKMTNTEMVKTLGDLGYAGQSPSSDLDEETVRAVRQGLETNKNGANGTGGTATVVAPETAAEVIEVPANITIKDLADKLQVGPGEIQKVLMSMGVLAALNQRLAPDAVLRIAQKLGKTVRSATAAAPAPTTAAAPAAGAGARVAKVAPTTKVAYAAGGAVKPRPAHGLAPRPPVVTIMGHVDHGKTTLLDALRKTSVAAGEAGGITQHIGAYQIETDGKRITFLDTPGHAAFSAMRARGAQVTDIIVLVVAADDGVMPQTEEAIEHAKAAKVPVLVAVNKSDLPAANPDRVLSDLTRFDLVPEAYGGNVITVNISAKTGDGLPNLLENILLMSEAEVDPKADPHGKAQGTVIEAKLDKSRGPIVTVLVQQGTLRVGDIVVVGEHHGKIRMMSDDKGDKVVKAGPSMPVEIIGLGSVPLAGDRLEAAKDEKEARTLAERRQQRAREDRLAQRSMVTLEDLYKEIREGAIKELNVVIKADVQGSVEAVRDSLEKLESPDVRVRVLSTGVGPVSENDILMATADKENGSAGALVVGFNVGPTPGAQNKAEQEHVDVRTYTIIYNLIDDVKAAMLKLLPPIYEEMELGKIEVRALFRLPRGTVIAGSYVTEGLVRRGAKARLFRGKNLLHTGEIDTLKRIKDDAREVQAGYECGLTLRDFNDIQENDTIECFELREIPREL